MSGFGLDALLKQIETKPKPRGAAKLDGLTGALQASFPPANAQGERNLTACPEEALLEAEHLGAFVQSCPVFDGREIK